MEKGTQIAYVPLHAKRNLLHKDVELGFVVSRHPGRKSHYCRYWAKGFPGELRPFASSELTPDDCIVQYKSVPQDHLDRVLSIRHI